MEKNNTLMDLEDVSGNQNVITDFGPDIVVEFGVTAKQGRRPYMEDRYVTIEDLSAVDTSLNNYEDLWNCTQCMYLNWEASSNCFVCSTPRKLFTNTSPSLLSGEVNSPMVQMRNNPSPTPSNPIPSSSLGAAATTTSMQLDDNNNTNNNNSNPNPSSPSASKEADTEVSGTQKQQDNQSASVQSDQDSLSQQDTQKDSQGSESEEGKKEKIKSKVRFFAVFDGHGGQLASTYVSSSLHRHLHHSTLFPSSPIAALHSTFLHVDSLYSARYPFLGLQDGSTACVLILIGTHLYCSNLGDSRAILCKGGKLIELSNDHKPDRESELKRVEKAGGIVKKGSFFSIPLGPFRIYSGDGVRGGLALARAFGDGFYKGDVNRKVDEQMVIAVPEIKEETVTRDSVDDWIVVASDGFWDVFSNEECVKYVEGLKKKNMSATEISASLCAEAFARDSMDNITVIVTFLKGEAGKSGAENEANTQNSATESQEPSTEEVEMSGSSL